VAVLVVGVVAAAVPHAVAVLVVGVVAAAVAPKRPATFLAGVIDPGINSLGLAILGKACCTKGRAPNLALLAGE
jgi:hypothetical protein